MVIKKSWKAVIYKGVSGAVLALLVLVNTGWTAEENVVVAEGEAVGNSLQARDEALSRALRNAIENGVGVFISSESKVENYQLLEDKIYSRVKGYIKKYEVLADNKGEGGIYKIKIKAEVAGDKLEKDLSDLGLLIARKGKPRTMILVSEDIEGRGWYYIYSGEGLTAQTQMEKAFLEKGFPLVSKDQMKEIKERDVALSFDDPARAAALGQRYGAEVVIVGQAVSDSVRTSAPYGLKTYSYSAEVQARVVKVDTASIIASDSSTAQQVDQGRFVAARKSLKEASNNLALALMDQITARWREEVYNEVSIQLVVEKIDFAELTELEEVLKGLEGVQNVLRRSFAKGIAVLDIDIKGTTEQLATDLSQISKPKLEIIGTTQNRIDSRIIK